MQHGPIKKRTKLRSWLGKEYFILMRKMKNASFQGKWAQSLSINAKLDHVHIQHQTPLLRRLKDVDMQLQHNKIRNLQLASERLNGLIIRPGESFSFWHLVGRPTLSKGYLEGLVIKSGEIGKGTGGGLCQLSNLIYWMLLHSSLTITERWRHSFDVFPDIDRKLPFGSGATLAYNYLDLRFANETDQTYQLVVMLDDQYLIGELRSERDPGFKWEVLETDHCFKQEWWGGYSRCNKLWKQKIAKDDHSEPPILIAENTAYVKYEPLLPVHTEA